MRAWRILLRCELHMEAVTHAVELRCGVLTFVISHHAWRGFVWSDYGMLEYVLTLS